MKLSEAMTLGAKIDGGQARMNMYVFKLGRGDKALGLHNGNVPPSACCALGHAAIGLNAERYKAEVAKYKAFIKQPHMNAPANFGFLGDFTEFAVVGQTAGVEDLPEKALKSMQRMAKERGVKSKHVDVTTIQDAVITLNDRKEFHWSSKRIASWLKRYGL